MNGGWGHGGITGAWEHWRTEAACFAKDGSMVAVMFPSANQGKAVEVAKAVCAGCPVRDACLEFAMTSRQEHGVWGGLTEDERRKLRRRRRTAAAGIARPAAS